MVCLSQITGLNSSKQTEREPPADSSSDKSGFSQLDASLCIVNHGFHCLQSKFPALSKARRTQKANGDFKCTQLQT